MLAQSLPCRFGARRCALVIAIAASLSIVAAAQDSDPDGYRMPPKALADLIDAPPTPRVSFSADKSLLIIMDRPSMPPIAELAQPELRLAGTRVNPRTNGRSRTGHTIRLTIKDVEGGGERMITGIPDGARIGRVSWSPDGARIAFSVTRDNGIELWTAEIEAAAAQRLIGPRLNAISGGAYTWLSNSRTLLVRLVPENRGAAPPRPKVPSGPVIKENTGQKAPARTYQDLLKNAHDEALFDHYFNAQTATVSLDGDITPIGKPGIIRSASPAPDGRHILITTIHRPFSYLVPMYRFPHRVEVWNTDGGLVKQIADLPLAEQVPIGFGAVPTGPRSFGWRADSPATLYWVEAQDGGDPRKKIDVRDILFTLAAPFTGAPVPLISLGLRYAGLTWGDDNLALVSERWWRTRKTRTWIVKPARPTEAATILFDRSYEDRYSDPGSPVMKRTPAGRSVLLTADGGKTLFLSGGGASPQGSRPFLDRLDLATKETKRLWQSEPPYYESVVDLLDEQGKRVITRRESKNEPPNYAIRDLSADTLVPITQFPHPTPQLAGVSKELVQYERADGVKLSATLYLPPGYTSADGPLPVLMWAYPREFKSRSAASQITTSPHRFVRVSAHSPLLWLLHGYAVFDGPTMPIIGEGDTEPNDTYVEQLVASAQAAADELVRRGVGDRERMAIGGHSYGAFMAANLLAHSDIFRAGIARSGAYNRTLTPFGFQAEERTFWEAPEIYFAMSPFMHAEKVNEPILMIHGEADNNSGTFPIQSQRYYAALKGHGAIARLVMLPHESHGYRARESVMHMVAEMTSWLDTYVKNAAPRDRSLRDRDKERPSGAGR